MTNHTMPVFDMLLTDSLYAAFSWIFAFTFFLFLCFHSHSSFLFECAPQDSVGKFLNLIIMECCSPLISKPNHKTHPHLQVHSEFCIGNCQIWFYVAMFTFVFYTGEMAYAISSIVNAPTNSRSIKSVLATLIYHAAKIIYRAFTLMIVVIISSHNN
jgi:hypothetical protein